MRLDPEELTALYSTDRPTRAMIESSPDFLDEIERGMGVCLVAYEGDRPTWLCFDGYSYD